MNTAYAMTSVSAYDALKASGMKERLHSRILNFIKDNGGDWSIGELAKALGLDKSNVSGRLNEMLNDINPPIVAKPTRKDRLSNRLVRPVGLPVIGQGDLFV